MQNLLRRCQINCKSFLIWFEVLIKKYIVEFSVQLQNFYLNFQFQDLNFITFTTSEFQQKYTSNSSQHELKFNSHSTCIWNKLNFNFHFIFKLLLYFNLEVSANNDTNKVICAYQCGTGTWWKNGNNKLNLFLKLKNLSNFFRSISTKNT